MPDTGNGLPDSTSAASHGPTRAKVSPDTSERGLRRVWPVLSVMWWRYLDTLRIVHFVVCNAPLASRPVAPAVPVCGYWLCGVYDLYFSQRLKREQLINARAHPDAITIDALGPS